MNRNLILALIGSVLLAGLFLLLRPSSNSKPGREARHSTTAELVIQRGRLASGTNVIQAHQGDEVSLRIRCDVPEEFHLHGYDRVVELMPGSVATLQFVADRSGRFDFELEKSGTELGALEVAPR